MCVPMVLPRTGIAWSLFIFSRMRVAEELYWKKHEEIRRSTCLETWQALSIGVWRKLFFLVRELEKEMA